MGKYADSTQWILPFNYLNGESVNAYALGHLARQHKMVDIALAYFNQEKNPKHIRNYSDKETDLFITKENNQLFIYSISNNTITFTLKK